MTLTLHIGLPKAASTYLQYSIFALEPGLRYVHNRRRSLLERLLQKQQRVGPLGRPFVEGALGCLLPREDLLVSDENLCMSAREPWLGVGPTPESLAKRASNLRRIVGKLRVVLTIRRQDHWLASRYAESAPLFSSFSQQDFEERASALCSSPASGSLLWLDYHSAYHHLCDSLGSDNILVFPSEMLAKEAARVVALLEAFLERDGWEARFCAGTRPKQRRNVRRREEDVWRLGGAGQLRLTSPVSSQILRRYERQNRNLATELGLELDQYGYF